MTAATLAFRPATLAEASVGDSEDPWWLVAVKCGHYHAPPRLVAIYTAGVQFSFRSRHPMNIKKLLCLVSVAALATSVTANAQSLTELAKQEKQRRAKSRTPAKLYTDGDKTGNATATGAEPAAGTDPAAAAAPAKADGSKKKEKTPEEMAAEKQKEWGEKVQKAQDEIKNLEDVIARNERSLASMFNITPARADMVNAIEADKKKVADLRQSLASLEEERRRAGMSRR
jgi:hypothetical protein